MIAAPGASDIESSPLARAVGPSRESFLALPCPRPAPALPFFCVRSPLPLSAGLSSCGSSELARSPSCTASYIYFSIIHTPMLCNENRGVWR